MLWGSLTAPVPPLPAHPATAFFTNARSVVARPELLLAFADVLAPSFDGVCAFMANEQKPKAAKANTAFPIMDLRPIRSLPLSMPYFDATSVRGLGTLAGHRVLIERWRASPAGNPAKSNGKILLGSRPNPEQHRLVRRYVIRHQANIFRGRTEHLNWN